MNLSVTCMQYSMAGALDRSLCICRSTCLCDVNQWCLTDVLYFCYDCLVCAKPIAPVLCAKMLTQLWKCMGRGLSYNSGPFFGPMHSSGSPDLTVHQSCSPAVLQNENELKKGSLSLWYMDCANILLTANKLCSVHKLLSNHVYDSRHDAIHFL